MKAYRTFDHEMFEAVEYLTNLQPNDKESSNCKNYVKEKME